MSAISLFKSNHAGYNYIKGNWQVNSGHPTWSFDKRDGFTIETVDDEAMLRLEIPESGKAVVRQTAFMGDVIRGNPGILYTVDEYNRIHGKTTFNATSLNPIPAAAHHALVIKIPAHSKLRIKRITSLALKDMLDTAVDRMLRKNLKGNIAIIVPSYPSEENRYLCAFVHARVKTYREAGIRCDVICAFDTYETHCTYSFEGVPVVRIPLSTLEQALEIGHYKKALLHFFDNRYAPVIKSPSTSHTNFFIWSHTPETMYWDWPLFTTPYFHKPAALSTDQIAEFKERDELIKALNDQKSVSWIFVSPFLKERSEKLIGIKFKRSHVIPNVVDEKTFPFSEKTPDLRKKIFIARKFDNVNKYALDIVAQCIIELSKRPFFSDLEFSIFGEGNYFDELTAPLADFPNVHIERRFLSRHEIAEEQSKHGIALYPTRWDSQGVSMGEAAMSGLAVVSSLVEAAQFFLPNDCGLLAKDIENPVEYADIIERLYRDPRYFLLCSKRCHEAAFSTARRELTIKKEIQLLRSRAKRRS